MSANQRHAGMPRSAPELTTVRPAIAAARNSGNQLITSGQTANRDGVNIATGTVGSTVDLETARQCAWQCARNVVDAAAREIGDLHRIESVTRVTVWVAATPDFTRHHLVADAATEYFQAVFGSSGVHTRAALGVASLPTGSPVEVDAIFQLRADEIVG